MSYYVYGGKITYKDYLAAKEFTRQVTTSIRGAGYQIALDVSRKTLAVIASTEGLARDQIQTGESVDNMKGDPGAEKFARLYYHYEESSRGHEKLDPKFHWGFCQVMVRIGKMNDSLADLLKNARTSAETAAYEQYEIACYAFDRELYAECLESLNKAINGDHTSPGYKLGWRFYQMKGIIQLGFVDGDMALMDLAAAEQSFLLAARYARADYPVHTGYAMLCAGWAAYCRGELSDALLHAELAMAIHPGLGEAFFLAAKIYMALDQVDQGLVILNKAIDLDRLFVLKAAADGDFQKNDDRLRGFLDDLRKEKYQQTVAAVTKAVDKITQMTEHSTDPRRNRAVSMSKRFLSEGEHWTLMDLMGIRGLADSIEAILNIPKDQVDGLAGKDVSAKPEAGEARVGEDGSRTRLTVDEGRPPGKAAVDRQTKTGPVTETRYSVGEVGPDARQVIDGMEFCSIPAGTFMMGKGVDKHQTTLTLDYLIGKYPVTQAQWEAIVGNNPSHFKGADHPVENVSWEECRVFIERINHLSEGRRFRFPTEAEWEYACRAGSTSLYVFGDDERLLDEYAWYYKNSGNKTHPVGKKKPNAWELYDMLGNVWEWCHDWYGDYPVGDVTDPTGPVSGINRVIRGGSWNNLAKYCRAENRNYIHPNDRLDRLGLRLVVHL
ncbi:MAG: SUMF1/EgtB/PvdO family nonheme iron enzyme [Deltaproteobacteria bacterium]|nr:SUMF1/EgtB/PvdO family nonheme iron enzyme [Deltaproteobacteria bacterium]